MIPYFELRSIPLFGGVSLAVFGTLVTLGVVAGVLFAEARARVVGIPIGEIHAAILWVVLPGFVGAHLAAALPHPGTVGSWRVSTLLEFWNGMSAFGGFAGAILGLAIHVGRRPHMAWLPIAEILVQALVIGWAFGRLGCTLVHDHLGAPSTIGLAIEFPDGPRHDLGWYELLFTLGVLVPAVLLLNRRSCPPGSTIATISLLYGPTRFLGDFLRHTDLPNPDPRYAGLTFAQYGCIVLTGVGLYFARHAAQRRGPDSRSARTA